jgi:hypothetical protein
MTNLSVWARPPIVILNLFQDLTLVLQGIKTLKQVQGDEAVAVESRWEGRRPYINRSPEQQVRSACDRRRVSKVQALRRWTPFDRLRAAVVM